MSRLNEIIENHEQLDDLFSVIKHYGVNAQFVSEALLKEFESRCGEDNSEKEDETELAYAQEMIEDLKQFSSRF